MIKAWTRWRWHRQRRMECFLKISFMPWFLQLHSLLKISENTTFIALYFHSDFWASALPYFCWSWVLPVSAQMLYAFSVFSLLPLEVSTPSCEVPHISKNVLCDFSCVLLFIILVDNDSCSSYLLHDFTKPWSLGPSFFFHLCTCPIIAGCGAARLALVQPIGHGHFKYHVNCLVYLWEEEGERLSVMILRCWCLLWKHLLWFFLWKTRRQMIVTGNSRRIWNNGLWREGIHFFLTYGCIWEDFDTKMGTEFLILHWMTAGKGACALADRASGTESHSSPAHPGEARLIPQPLPVWSPSLFQWRWWGC